jgi:hypothetical protein
MRGLKNLGVAAVGTILLTVAASSSADARYKRDWRLDYQSGTTIVIGLAPATTRPYYDYGYRYGWYRDYAPAGPFVDYPYQNCSGGVCWY